jgi:sigma-54 dependent transcriptional regulator, acetoin dehydrogenase operon transcriptional activator AcoR
MSSMDTAETAAEQAHAILEREGELSPELLPADIYQSWQRCLALGLDPGRPPEVKVVADVQLQEARERLGLASDLAATELRTLHSQIAGTSFMIAFADANGLLLEVIADSEFATAARVASLRPGSVWTEETCGTNALGGAIIQRQSVIIHRAEHFFRDHLNLTCIAHPVFSPDGTMIGVIDASSNCDARQRHTKVLVQLAATQIENGLFRQEHRGDTIIAIHQRSEYLHSLSAGLIAVRGEGEVVGINTQARTFLRGRSIEDGPRLEQLFDLQFDALLRETRARDTVRLRDTGGLPFVARMESQQPQAPAAPALRVQDQATKSVGRPPSGMLPFVAEDARVRTILRDVELAVGRQLPILIRGETGTGKELMARYAHAASGRKGAFVPINCAALPDSLIEAELFGYADGAFTGARRGGAKGLVAEADGGTLFLDEIGELPMALQAVLLRLLDDWTVRPVGGQRSIVDVQLVSATNVKLDAAVANGKFRSDLLYRMNALEVTLPNLASRTDVEALANHLLVGIAPGCRLDAGALDHIRKHQWPGNIRQLRNELSRASLKAADGLIDRAILLAACTSMGSHELPKPGVAPKDETSFGAAMQPVPVTSLRDLHRTKVLAVLAETGGNISQAARRLQVSRNTIYRALGDSGEN